MPGALYDMVKDPGQKENVAERNPKIVMAMRTAYEQFWKDARPLMVNEGVSMSPTRPFHVWYAEQMKSGGIPQWKVPKF